MQNRFPRGFQLGRAHLGWVLVSVLLGVWPAASAEAQQPEAMRALQLRLAGLGWPVSLLDATLQLEGGESNGPRLTPDEAAQLALPGALATDGLRRKQSRYRTMAVTGFVIASIAFVATAATMAGEIYMRRQHENGSYTCGPYLTPYLTVPAFVAGLSVGLRGTFAGRRLRVEHPALGEPDRTRARRMGAIMGTVFSMSAAAFSVPGFFCNS